MERVVSHCYACGLPGRLAQLGERLLDKQEVTGSSPVSPIKRSAFAGLLCLWFETSSIRPLIRGSRLARHPWLAWHARESTRECRPMVWHVPCSGRARSCVAWDDVDPLPAGLHVLLDPERGLPPLGPRNRLTTVLRVFERESGRRCCARPLAPHRRGRMHRAWRRCCEGVSRRSSRSGTARPRPLCWSCGR